MHGQRLAVTNFLRNFLKFGQNCNEMQTPSRNALLLTNFIKRLAATNVGTATTTKPGFVGTIVLQKRKDFPPKAAQHSLSTFAQFYAISEVSRSNVPVAGAAIPFMITCIRPYSKFSNICTLPLSEEKAQDLIFNLKDSERAAIKTALEKYEAGKVKEGYEGALAATRWRTRFGRLTKLPALGDVDPTGTFCAFPDDWLKKKAAERAKEPTRNELWRLCFVNAAPFFAFGFLDNFVMVVAGDYIEFAFGSFMCISTMAAAGLGNTVSDVIGIGSAVYVERGCDMLGFRTPDLTPVQMEMKSSRRAANFGRIIGITIGCLIGMFPLLFLKPKHAETEANEAEKKVEQKTTKT